MREAHVLGEGQEWTYDGWKSDLALVPPLLITLDDVKRKEGGLDNI